MSYDIGIGQDHDLVFDTNGDLLLIENALRVGQQIKVTLLLLLGEWFLNTDFGVPYLEQILVKNPRMAIIQAILRSKIIDVPGVSRVLKLDLEFNRAQRTLVVTYNCETPFGLTGPHNVALSIRGTNG